MKSLQEIYAPNSICFGCGPANERGLKIRSFAVSDRETHAEFVPEKYQEAFPGMVNGGIIGALLDCHSNWTACYALMKQAQLEEPPCTVTADFHVKLKAPTPSNQKIILKARVIELKEDRARIEAELFTAGASCLSSLELNAFRVVELKYENSELECKWLSCDLWKRF